MILYRARWVVPITAAPIANGMVGVEGTRIAFVGSADDAPPGDEIDLGHVMLMPGLVNAHCHLELTAMRGFLEDLDFRRWILRLTNARRAVFDRDALLDSARYGVEEGLLSGVTTYADTGDSGVSMQAMREAGVRGINFQEVFGPDPAQCADSIAALKEKVAGLQYTETPLVRVGVSPHAPYTVSDDLFRATTEFARERHLPMAIHIAESELEQQLIVDAEGSFADGLRRRGIGVERRGATPIELLERLGVLDVKPLLIHCVRANAADVSRIAVSESPVAHCPASNAKLGHGVAPLGEMLAAGITVGLGSDSMASNNRMDLLEEARLALFAQRVRLGSHSTPSAEDVLELATIGGAAALGLGDQIGSIDVGKQADLAAFGLDAIEPTQDPVSAAIFSTSGARTRFVCVAGKPLVRDGRLVSSREGLAARVRSLGQALGEWLDAGGEMQGVV
ncbi:MAG TPA: amidohydrolase family protein [Gemmatimonadaceae bacterium]|jgi:5-methylthioadenosine/S-adenosylhomocysteine deaminase